MIGGEDDAIRIQAGAHSGKFAAPVGSIPRRSESDSNVLSSFGNMHFDEEVKSEGLSSIKKFIEENELFLHLWNDVLVMMCIIATSLDPLFCYVLFVDEDRKCIGFDKNLRVTVVVLRSLVDFAYIILIVFHLRIGYIAPRNANDRGVCALAWRYFLSNLTVDILAALPLPQVAGAFWYFFAVERELYCWQKTCKAHNECKAKSFFCDDITGNEKFVDKFCPVNPPDPSIFDFGIYLDAHQNGVSRLKNFPLKLLYCFSWGLRTLSSFGSNLNPSICSFENIFTVLVSITGILLVVYLIGNLQVYLQSSTSRSKQRRRLMQGKENEIISWIKDYDIQGMEYQNNIMQCIRDKFDENEDVNLKNLLNIFPTSCIKQIKEKLFSTIQERDSKLKIFGEDELKGILAVVAEHVKPVIYAEDSYIIQEGEPVYQMIFIGRGIAWAYSGSSSTECLERGGFLGEEVVNWALEDGSLTNIPLSTKTVKSQKKVEAFAVMAHDLKTYLKKSSSSSS